MWGAGGGWIGGGDKGSQNFRLTELDGRVGSTCQHTEECHEKGRGREDYCGIREGDEGGEEVGDVGREIGGDVGGGGESLDGLGFGPDHIYARLDPYSSKETIIDLFKEGTEEYEI